MNMRIGRKHQNRTLSMIVLLLLFSTAGVRVSFGQQPGRVVLQVEMPSSALRKGLRVRAISQVSRAAAQAQELTKQYFNFTTHLFTFTMSLAPGAYDFVVCDHLDLKPALHNGIVKSGAEVTVYFHLDNQEQGNRRIAKVLAGPDGRPMEPGAYVFLHDVTTGCTVAETSTQSKGRYEFKNLPERSQYQESKEEADQNP